MRLFSRINRNIVECKYSTFLRTRESCNSINRNIVECKFQKTKLRQRLEHSINRNIVECKYMLPLYHAYLLFVLIETLWNVNFKKLNSDNGWNMY